MDTYIESLYLENVGKFDKLKVTFNPQMNVIIGPNGIGKTSILRGICHSFTISHLDSVRCRAGACFNVHCIDHGNRILVGADNLVKKNQDYRQMNIEQWCLHDEDGYKNFFMHQSTSYHLLAIGAYRYFNYIQIGGMNREQGTEERQKSYIHQNPEFIDSTAMPNIKQWMINRYFIIDKPWAKNEKANWNILNEKIGTIAPNGSNFEFLRIERDLEPIFSLNGKECYLEELSSGFKSVISILFTIIDWIEGVNTGEESLINNAVGTVLVDEVDVHLHPSWQLTILQSLREIFPRLQFIVTTHSPQVVMSAKLGEVILMQEDMSEVDLKPIAHSFQSWQSKDILRELMNTGDLSADNIEVIQESLNRSLQGNDIEEYDSSLSQLESLLHPSDSILKYYKLSRNKILLSKNDYDTDKEEL